RANVLNRMSLFSQKYAGKNGRAPQLTFCLLSFRHDLGQRSSDFRILSPIEVGGQRRLRSSVLATTLSLQCLSEHPVRFEPVSRACDSLAQAALRRLEIILACMQGC